MPDDYIFRFFEQLPRQGPGSNDQTLKALDMIRPSLSPTPSVLDLGCGNGAQTIALAQALPSAFITAVDLYLPYLKHVRSRSSSAPGAVARKFPCRASMLELPFGPESFDLIWSEGAIYVAGFKNGLELWQNLLHPQGFIAVTEVVWLTAERPKEVTDFWQNEYPGICSIDDCRSIIRETGLSLVSDFVLPDQCWDDNFYMPARTLVESDLNKTLDASEIKFLKDLNTEIETYDKYKAYYGYAFFIMQKRKQ